MVQYLSFIRKSIILDATISPEVFRNVPSRRTCHTVHLLIETIGCYFDLLLSQSRFHITD